METQTGLHPPLLLVSKNEKRRPVGFHRAA